MSRITSTYSDGREPQVDYAAGDEALANALLDIANRPGVRLVTVEPMALYAAGRQNL
jgi:hypothetical protein